VYQVYPDGRTGLKIKNWSHVGIVVDDLEMMTDFYVNTIGLERLHEIDARPQPDGDHTGVPNVHRTLRFVGIPGDHEIELIYFIDPPATDGHVDVHKFGSTHICWDVEDLASVYEELKDKMEFVTEPKWRTRPDGSTVGLIYGQDPEGNWLEFTQRP